jgi:Skp family chaperone for outer membrane proteins
MNPPTPTPRTNAAWAKTFESELNQFWSGNAANQMRDECEKLERELTETERLRFGADADRRRLRAEVERWKTVAAQMTAEREHNANEASRLRAELQAELAAMKDTPTL